MDKNLLELLDEYDKYDKEIMKYFEEQGIKVDNRSKVPTSDEVREMMKKLPKKKVE